MEGQSSAATPAAPAAAPVAASAAASAAAVFGRLYFGRSAHVNPGLQPEISPTVRHTMQDRVLELDAVARGCSQRKKASNAMRNSIENPVLR